MNRGILLGGGLALLICVGSPSFGDEVEPESERSDRSSRQEDSEPPEGRKQWRAVLLPANQRVAIAEERSAAAQKAYKIMRRRRRPRGEGKQAIMDEVGLSRDELTHAQLELDKLEKTARRAGALPIWLKFNPAEMEAATR